MAAAPYYEGKAIRIIVGTSPGGGYDTYTRLIARHYGKYIPGNPTIIVDNMPGAGGTVSANHLFKVAKGDGLTIGHFVGGQFLQQLLGRPGIEFDALKFEYIGVPAQDHFVLGIAKASGVMTIEQWLVLKTPLKFGAIAPETELTTSRKSWKLPSACRFNWCQAIKARRRFRSRLQQR